VKYGDVVELFSYQMDPVYRMRPDRHRRSVVHRARVSSSSVRSRRNFHRLVASNIALGECYMFTLTWEQVQSTSDAYKRFSKFALMTRRACPESRYIAVIEWMKNGRPHFHVLFFDLQFEFVQGFKPRHDSKGRLRFWGKDVLLAGRPFSDFWPYAFTFCKKTDRSIALAHYLSKYLSKAVKDPRLGGKKAYTASRNCIRPTVISSYSMPASLQTFKNMLNIESVDNPLDPLIDKSFNTKYLGKGNYKLYNLKEK